VAVLPQPDRNEIHAFLDFWRELPREERALFATSVKPDLSDKQIARITGEFAEFRVDDATAGQAVLEAV
jgi:hypothetical protein